MYKVFLLSRERQRDNGLRKAMCYGTLATSTLIIIIFRNVENFKIIKIRRNFFCGEILLEYPGTFQEHSIFLI
jgi:ATP adenylyltransferase/5',5'''-P-1,P-4-tetraphosphate phosphorylase II